MTIPVFDEIYGPEESVQMMTSARNSQTIPIVLTDVAVTLKTPSIIVNNTAAAGFIAYLLVDDVLPNYTIEYFAAGQEKRRRVTLIGGSRAGSTVTEVLVLEA